MGRRFVAARMEIDEVEELIASLEQHATAGANSLAHATAVSTENRMHEAAQAFAKSLNHYTQAVHAFEQLTAKDPLQTAFGRMRRTEVLSSYEDIEAQRERVSKSLLECADRQAIARRLAVEADKYLTAGEPWQAAKWVDEAREYDIESPKAREVWSQLVAGGFDAARSGGPSPLRELPRPKRTWIVFVGLGLALIIGTLILLSMSWQAAYT